MDIDQNLRGWVPIKLQSHRIKNVGTLQSGADSQQIHVSAGEGRLPAVMGARLGLLVFCWPCINPQWSFRFLKVQEPSEPGPAGEGRAGYVTPGWSLFSLQPSFSTQDMGSPKAMSD